MSTDALPLVEQAQPRPDWLAELREEILEPDLPIVDPHHHFSPHWGGYFGPDLVADLASGHAVAATVYVQCGHGYRNDGPPALAPVGETENVIRITADAQPLAPATRLCAGIVGTADLGLGEAVDEVLQAQIEAGQGRFRGIRRSAARHAAFRYGVLEPPPFGLYADAQFRRGFSRLQRFGLSFDALCYHDQLHEVESLAQAFPGVSIVLNHLGVPLGVGPYQGRQRDVRTAWRLAMQGLARCANVSVKLGGWGMTTFGLGFAARERPATSAELAAALRPDVEDCLELFGPARCMFESNFPVDKCASSYHVLWNAFKRIAAGASQQDKRALFHDTAVRVYRLETP